MSLKEKFNDIDEMTDLLFELTQKQTKDFNNEFAVLYSTTLIYKITKNLGAPNAEELKDGINEFKGAILLAEMNKEKVV